MLPVASDRLWPVMTDHALYAKLALNLTAATGLTPNGPGFERTCSDTRGRSWSETCTLWQPGRRYDVAVDTTAEDYPYPLQTLLGSWAVEPVDGQTPSASSVTMLFAIQPKPGLLGRLFVPLMHLSFGPVLRRIVRGWSHAATT